ncbi:MAG TPA: Crp/Fnr family transcriptional regulator [Candidatus Anaerofilum faecale]|nr:Crp/Fnr family transcriptional regulator [Candidatus Anaerofilum faecale]
MRIEEFLRDFLDITDKALVDLVCTSGNVKQLRKGELLIRQGEKPTYIYLTVAGVFRGCFMDANGKDITDCFVFKPGLPVMPSYDLTAPAAVGIEALTPAQVLSIPMETFKTQMMVYPQVQQLYLKFLIRSNELHWELKMLSYQNTAMERYRWFLINYPGLIDRVSHKYIASFLNMTPVTFSRLVNWES